MATTLLRLGLWTVILVLVLYVLVTTYPDEPWAELITMTMLQQALTLAGIVVAAGIVVRILGKGAKVVTVANRCRICRRPIGANAIYCRDHLRSIVQHEDERTRTRR